MDYWILDRVTDKRPTNTAHQSLGKQHRRWREKARLGCEKTRLIHNPPSSKASAAKTEVLTSTQHGATKTTPVQCSSVARTLLRSSFHCPSCIRHVTTQWRISHGPTALRELHGAVAQSVIWRQATKSMIWMRKHRAVHSHTQKSRIITGQLAT